MHRAALLCSAFALLPTTARASESVGSIPIELHRRAADFLEENRGEHGGTWADARLASEAEPMWRPGLSQPAYYEVAVLGPDGSSRGYISLSHGEHDFPVPIAAFGGVAPARELRDRVGDDRVVIYRLGLGAYVADLNGTEVGSSGDPVGRLHGFEPEWVEASSEASAGTYSWSDAAGVSETRAELGASISFTPWEDWSTLLSDYAENMEPLLRIQHDNATRHWAVERSLADNGEALRPGEFRDTPVLSRGGARFELSGLGQSYAHVELVERGFQGDAALRFVVVGDVPSGDPLPVDVNVTYGDGSRETIRFNVFGAAAPVGVAPVESVRAARCSQMAFQTDWRTYLHADGGGGAEVNGRGRWIGDHELFNVVDRGVGQIALRTFGGQYVSAHNGGVEARAKTVGDPEVFFLDSKRDGRFGLRSFKRQYVRVHADGRVTADSPNFHDWESFNLERCEPKRKTSLYAGAHWWDAWKKVRKYGQIPAHHGPSTSQCSSGCGATAWGMLFGFHDYEAAKSIGPWARHWGLFRKDGGYGANATAPHTMWPTSWSSLRLAHRVVSDMHPGVANMIWEISQKMNDWGLAGCSNGGQKWTAPVLMGRAHKYLEGRSSVTLVSDYDGLSKMTEKGRNKAGDVLRAKQPVVIGIGYLEHYPLAFGYDYTRYRVWDRSKADWTPGVHREAFVIHSGHQEAFAELVPFDTWEQGWIKP
ncbi:MAG: fascin domain-containing protein [Nannocystales bacterium]